MTLQNINRAMMAVLLSTSVALVLVVLWGLNQLQATYKLAQDYYQVRETLSGDWRARINDYLDTGDGVKLDAAIQQLDAITTGELTRLPDSLQAQLQPPIAALQDALNNDLRGAGKLAGDPQALLMNDENELRGKLALLAGLAADKQRTQPDLSSHYLVAINEMHDELAQVIFSRERHYQHGSAETEKNIAARISALKNLQQQLNALPSLQVVVAKQKSEFDLGGSDDASAEERSSELRREIGSILNRYHDDMQRTGHMLAAGTAAKQAVREQVQSLLQVLAERETDISAYQSGIRHKVQFALFTLILMVLAVCAVLFWLQYRLSQVARSVGEFQKKLASGDLREHLHLHSRIEDINELGQSTEVLQNSLIELTQALTERSGQVASASVLVLQSTQELQTSVERQLENSTQASSAIGQMSSASRTVSAEVAAVVAITREADLTLTDGAGIIDRSVSGMSILADEIAATISALNQLQSHASGIQAFVGNIQGIADQTNLLALNAAIEAARAGEQGRGFAVVADEVRTLAQRSSEATIEIERLVEKVNASARNLADVMHRQTASAQHTAEEIRAAGSIYQDLEAGVLRIRTAIADIAELTTQQDRAAHAVQSFINDTVNASSESKARSQDSVTISMQLDHIARQVREIAQQFQT